MLDIIIKGGDVVTPEGVVKADVGIKGERIAARRSAGNGEFPERRPRHRRQRQDRHARRRRSARPHGASFLPFPVAASLFTRGPDHVGMAALYGGTTTLIDFAYIHSDGSVEAGIESRDKQFAGIAACDYAYHLMLHSEPAHTLMGELAEAIEAGYPTVKIFMTNIWPHRQGRMVDLGDMWEVFKVLAHDRRPRRHPCRGQRPRHAHVRQAHPRGPHRLREPVRGAQPAVRGHLVPPRDPAGRKRAGLRALHDARLRRDRRCRHPRGARQGPADLRREPAPVHALHRGGLQAPERPDLSHLSVSQVEGRPARSSGPARGTAPSIASRPTTSAARSRKRRWATASTTRPAATPASSRGLP